ncbi:AbrB family transcriptional regulator [Curvibacter sp. HBC61]|uniref:AbrB family transcriptional regulator n=1 Tax=Curvibacter cyanobacteriorum TaxID=3026422 RepID=A0ABT5N4T6_9BURK|nr:AbrB family transcriptional regulator [Curvibacter sp. HBC61]MDD0841063.1 AbrB family transcriptional regulator [Curvibacter sp. HBC61]
MRLSFLPQRPWHVLGTLVLAGLSALLFAHWHIPLPWMLGPLLSVAVACMAGAPAVSHAPLRNLGQWTIAAALGLYFTPEVTALVLSLWWAIALCVLWALLLGWGFGQWLTYRHRPELSALGEGRLRATTYFAAAIGGASEMTLLAERAHARTDLVALAHSLRLVIVTVLIPFALTFSGLHGLDSLPQSQRQVDWVGLGWLALATGAGAWVMRALGRANPWFLGSLVVSSGLTMAGIGWSALPVWMSNTAQLLIGVSLGVRFMPGFWRSAPRWMASVVLGTLVMVALCAAWAAGLAWCTGLHPATLVLGTSPGGIAEMAITAKVLKLGVPVVTAFQVCRLVAVLLLAEPVFRWLYGRAPAP